MRSLIAMFALIFTSTSWAAKTLIIVDVDDTIRLTHRKSSAWEQLQNVADTQMGFYGMREILDGLNEQQASIYYVSGTVAPISDFGADFLYANDFPQQEHYFYRGWFEETKEFKVRMIEELVLREKPDRIIMFGDNGEKDSAAFGEIVAKYTSATSYIHKIYGLDGVEVPSTQSIFLTAADLALQLHLSGDLSAAATHTAIQAVRDGLAIHDSFYWQFVFPDWGDISATDIERAFGSKTLWTTGSSSAVPASTPMAISNDDWAALADIEIYLRKNGSESPTTNRHRFTSQSLCRQLFEWAD